MRLLVLVEGDTEEVFVTRVLAPHLLQVGVYAAATKVGTPRKRGSSPLKKGGGHWSRWERDIRRILGEQPHGGFRLTTFFDLYGLPLGYPGLGEHGTDLNTTRRCENLEADLAQTIGDNRLIPYLQRHEFEAVVLACLPSLGAFLDAPDDLAGHAALQKEIAGQAPEDIDDGVQTAPSKRLLAHIPGYRKTIHGPLAAEDAGIASLRAKCPRFDAWVTRLEALGQPDP